MTNTQGPCGILLTNLGTPEAPTSASVRRYLGEFLWDPRVIEAPRWLWWLILHGVILRIRPRRSAALYRKVWQPAGSPLLLESQAQARALKIALEGYFPAGLELAVGMRYGTPSIAAGISELVAAGVERMLVLPMYPQYSASTVGSTFDAVGEALRKVRAVPELRIVNGYHSHPLYVDALSRSIRAGLSDAPAETKLLFSFHGLPQRYVDNGDPYQTQCQATAQSVADALQLPDDAWAVGYQSRVGREEWLRPYTDDLLSEWGHSGVRSVAVVCPGFSADCLETLDEIEREANETFLEAGGETFRYIPALNAATPHIEMLRSLVLEKTTDWQDPPER